MAFSYNKFLYSFHGHHTSCEIVPRWLIDIQLIILPLLIDKPFQDASVNNKDSKNF